MLPLDHRTAPISRGEAQKPRGYIDSHVLTRRVSAETLALHPVNGAAMTPSLGMAGSDED